LVLAFANYSGKIHSSAFSFIDKRKHGANAGKGIAGFPWTINELEDIQK
jgi:hypothetical protein